MRFIPILSSMVPMVRIAVAEVLSQAILLTFGRRSGEMVVLKGHERP